MKNKNIIQFLLIQNICKHSEDHEIPSFHKRHSKSSHKIYRSLIQHHQSKIKVTRRADEQRKSTKKNYNQENDFPLNLHSLLIECHLTQGGQKNNIQTFDATKPFFVGLRNVFLEMFVVSFKCLI